MNSINLLPARHRARLHTAAMLRRWLTAGGLYAAILGLAVLAAHCFCTVDDHSVATELEHVQAASAQLARVHAASLAQLQAVQVQTSLRDAVNAPPDFAALLTAIASSCGEDAVLTSLKWDNIPAPQALPATAISTSPSSANVDPLAGLAGIKLELSGLARAQAGVGLVVQRLQDTHLFDDVRLTKTSREGFLSGDALAFHLGCVIEPGARSRSAP